ncbi:Uncharacterized 2Fe-2 and 4Fe-4S clusters-containing protein, contains DUF4445 domain [Natronincola ferrireducens]|uniref:Uncharacterized 2Fe-2 and 4Fe-4S clusters-containing protein, contains DUF4445 domain n=2 Tax=Natronincola ferrireducens TaxID=393762 RepID=A0A1G9FUU5_9FIRM|nr:Uncharacterized 2Fe-2 and 4Fe-4S clusters-containing protein, contains DUF4445 domain [Natronincola ferrireducens]
MMKLIVKSQEGSKTLDIHKEKSILSLLQEANIYLSAPCDGRGTCGKCKIKVLKGNLGITLKDQVHFSHEELDRGYRLACSAYPEGDIEIAIETVEKGFAVVTEFQGYNNRINHGFEVIDIDLSDGNWQDTKSMVGAIQRNLGKTYKVSYKALKRLSVITNPYISTSSLHERSSLQLLVKDTNIVDVFYKETIGLYGVAIDIGTTTLGFHLINLQQGEIIKTYSMLNSQRIYGADVIARVQRANAGKLEVLNQLIKQDIITGIENLLKDADIDKGNIYSIAIAGNTTMLHLLLKLSPETLGQFPFTAVTLELISFSFKEIFDSPLLDCGVVLLPGLDAYIGADIVAGVLYHEFSKTEEINMLIDIGTNGEMVIGNKHSMLATATAAGPAFEGGNITCGTGCIMGAITSITYNGQTFNYETMGNKKPVGICGSGIIDIMAEGLRYGWIDSTGRLSEAFSNGEVVFYQNSGGDRINFTQKDIREVQLAKSALRSGIECLIKQYDVDYDAIKRIYLAGGFGSNINIEAAMKIGLLPREFKDKIKFVGNTSLGGAVKYLLDRNCGKDLEAIMKAAKPINLSTDPQFNHLFMENMLFQ